MFSFHNYGYTRYFILSLFFFRNLETRISGPSSLGPDLHKFHLSPAFLNLTTETHQNFYFLLYISRSQKKIAVFNWNEHNIWWGLWLPGESSWDYFFLIPQYHVTNISGDVVGNWERRPIFFVDINFGLQAKVGIFHYQLSKQIRKTDNQALNLNTRDKKSE